MAKAVKEKTKTITKERSKHVSVNSTHGKPLSDAQRLKQLRRDHIHDTAYDHLVKKTFDYPRFLEKFTFPVESPGWTSTRAIETTKRKAKYPRVVSLDCEMCVTMDPNTRDKDSRALVRATIVDLENPDDVLVDCIVRQPENGHQVVNYKTDIHGIEPEIIENAQHSFREVQKKVLKVLSKDTIIVGQSVYGDLISLKIEHYRCIDTAMIFKREGDTTGTKMPSLKDLAHNLLNLDMPEVHDSCFDAKICALAVSHALKNGIGAPIKRVDEPLPKAKSEYLTQLRFHSVPKGLTAVDLQKLVLERCYVVPLMIDDIAWKEFVNGGVKRSMGSTTALFLSADHANLAFDTLEGETRLDSIQRPEKLFKFDGKFSGRAMKGKFKVGKMSAVSQ